MFHNFISKKVVSVILILGVFSLISCSPIIKKTYIHIQTSDVVGYQGEVKFKVERGDILEVTHSQTCRTGSGVCWEVRKVNTGEWGFVNAETMKRRHQVSEENQ